jgi:hypothetical protein
LKKVKAPESIALACIAGLALLVGFIRIGSTAEAQHGASQRVLGPALYVFQTRLDHSSCGDSGASGSVTSYFAAIDGIPGSREMTMHLLNSNWWSTWRLTVTAEGQVVGDSQQDRVEGPRRGDSHFELTRDGEKFTGRGSRSYTATIDGHPQRCRMSYDALLRRLHE